MFPLIFVSTETVNRECSIEFVRENLKIIPKEFIRTANSPITESVARVFRETCEFFHIWYFIKQSPWDSA